MSYTLLSHNETAIALTHGYGARLLTPKMCIRCRPRLSYLDGRKMIEACVLCEASAHKKTPDGRNLWSPPERLPSWPESLSDVKLVDTKNIARIMMPCASYASSGVFQVSPRRFCLYTLSRFGNEVSGEVIAVVSRLSCSASLKVTLFYAISAAMVGTQPRPCLTPSAALLANQKCCAS